MSEEKGKDDLSKWFSSYGLITAERILGKYNIRLESNDLLAGVKNPDSFYYHILRVPVKNVRNGLILTQAKEYHLYLQKLYIDYFLSGEASKDSSFPGADTREDINDLGEAFKESSQIFIERERQHNKLIAESQAYFIGLLKQWQKAMDQSSQSIEKWLKGKNIKEIKQASYHVLAYCPYSELADLDKNAEFIKKLIDALGVSSDDETLSGLAECFKPILSKLSQQDETLNDFNARIDAMADELRAYRTQFYQSILQTTELLTNLSDYKIDLERVKANKEALNFDKDLL